MPFIRCSELSVVFRPTRRPEVVALQDLNISIERGEFVTILGPSGCGKSTLLKVLGGLLQPDAGHVSIGEKGVTGPGSDRAMVFQEIGLMPWRTALANVELGLELRGMPTERRRSRAMELLKAVGLEGFEMSYPHELSGGMRQRVGIARALAVDPEILLMDEPFAAVDAQTREIMQDDLLTLWEREKKTVVFVTHSIEEAIYLADRVIVITARPGRVKEETRTNLGRPRDYRVRASSEFSELRLKLWEALRTELVAVRFRQGG